MRSDSLLDESTSDPDLDDSDQCQKTTTGPDFITRTAGASTRDIAIERRYILHHQKIIYEKGKKHGLVRIWDNCGLRLSDTDPVALGSSIME